MDQLNIDFEQYIKPQQKKADIAYKLSGINQRIKEQKISDSRVGLNIKIKDGLYCQDLLRVLIGICGLQVNMNKPNGTDSLTIDIQGDIVAEDIKFASKIITPGLNEFIDNEGGFKSGKLGLMQLIALIEIDHVLKRRKRLKTC
jgi:hypothetical protein